MKNTMAEGKDKDKVNVVLKENREFICKELKLTYSKLTKKQKQMIDDLTIAFVYWGIIQRDKAKAN